MSLYIIEYTDLTESELTSFKTQDGKVHLFNNLVCPFGHRALWTAAEAGIPFDMINIELGNMPDSYVENFNRYHTVPFLLDNGYPVFESAIVAQFLDAKYNNGEFQCRDDPEHAALAQLAMAKFQPSPIYALLRNQDASKMQQLKDNLSETMQDVETIYRDNASEYRSKGPYLLGDKISSAEINIMTFLFRFQYVLQHYRDFELMKDVPLLQVALDASVQRPAFQLTSREPEFYINYFGKYANP
ncbi:hypothetical protein THRCLA_06296 [Thraustotheca clavata]|uniref:GST N-terminal domain-containing protein n=1 Tax=Thraustotheca clavata TaxID=74557 RepID=A0A1V9ZPT3_9STRA|nr:hypothetical protein THRCLA_06296 [Thraustotheca clavata]